MNKIVKFSFPFLVTVVVAINLFGAQPNVIFFAVDDMNDWSGPLDSDMAHTPNMDRLAEMGVTFLNAHTAGIYCAPSRAAIFTGRYAFKTGVYGTQTYFVDHPEYKPLQVAFKEAGYSVFGTGKLFHHPAGEVDQRGWDEFFVRTEAQRKSGWPMDSWEHGAPLPDPYPHSAYNKTNPKWTGRPFMEVGPIPNDKEDEMADSIRTQWVIDLISREHDKPFFVGLGLYAPHYPNYAPQRFFDMYPLDEIKRPPWKEDDLDDLPDIVRKKQIARKKQVHDKLIELGEVDKTIQGYLACMSYADHQLGRVLDALEKSPNADDTIIVFWSDHGFTHGQKGHWGKHTLWERTSNVPFLWAGPGIAKDVKTNYTASLLDMYPTFIELCGLQSDPDHDGQSLAPVLKKPTQDDSRNVYLPHDHPGSYAIINGDWRYIEYEDGSEELYDLNKDPDEWYNLAKDPDYASIKKALRSDRPKSFAPMATGRNQLNLVIDGEHYKWVKKK